MKTNVSDVWKCLVQGWLLSLVVPLGARCCAYCLVRLMCKSLLPPPYKGAAAFSVNPVLDGAMCPMALSRCPVIVNFSGQTENHKMKTGNCLNIIRDLTLKHLRTLIRILTPRNALSYRQTGLLMHARDFVSKLVRIVLLQELLNHNLQYSFYNAYL